MLYITDTHSLVWFLTDDPKLGRNALKVFQETEKGKNAIIIPTIVLAEIMYIAEKKKAAIKFKDLIAKLEYSLNYVPYNLDLEVLKKSQTLTKIPELHDKIITATALIVKATILTKDPIIKSSGYVKIVW